MMINTHRFRKTMATAILLFLIGSAVAAPPEVRDDAYFFSAKAVSDANDRILQIKQRHGKDLQVETFPELPANLKDQFQKNKTFADWAAGQSAKGKIDGIYILICKNPGHLEVLVGDATLKKAFPAKDRDALRDLLLKHFKDKTHDDGLTEAVAFVKQRFEQNIGTVLPAAALNSVQDHGAFFSAKAIERNNSEIKEIHLRFKKDVVVETFAAPPEKVKLAFDAAGAEEKNKVITNWANDRAKEAKVDGVLILVCRNPSKLQIVATEDTLKKALVAKERDQIVGILIKNFKLKEFDKALNETVDFVFDSMDRNLSPTLPMPTIGGITGNFAVETTRKAKREIEALGQTVTIDALSQPPPGQWKQVEAMTPEARAQFFADLLKTRSAGDKADGIHVMICRQPINVQVALGATIQQKAFTPANRDELVDILTASLQAKELDKGLLKGLEYVGATLAKNMPIVAIRDDANFFSPEARDKAIAAIGEIRREFHKDILVETFKDIPAERREGVDLSDRAARDKLFATWMNDRQTAAKNDGVHLLICKDPTHLEAATGVKGVSTAERTELAKILLDRFKEKKFDEGLTDAVGFIAKTLRKNQVSTEPAKKVEPVVVEPKTTPIPPVAKEEFSPVPKEVPPPVIVKTTTKVEEKGKAEFEVPWWVWGGGILLGLWLCFRLLGALFGGRKPPTPPSQMTTPVGSNPPPTSYPNPGQSGPYPTQQTNPHPTQQYPPQQYPQAPQSGGGGLLTSVLGGLFGGAAGSWMYDRMRTTTTTTNYPPQTHNPYPQPQAPSSPRAPVPPMPPAPPVAPGYSSAGGDFGDAVPAPPAYSGSGGDFGAPDEQPATSGGDFGAAEEQPTTSGGDFGAPEDTATGAGGDFGGGEAAATDSTGGDFGS